MQYFLRSSLAVALTVAGLRAVAAAEARDELASLFAAGTKNTTPSVEAARQIAVALKRANLQDMRIDYAYGLVLANQSRYAEACRLIGRYLAAQPDDLAAQRAKLWAQMQQNQFPAALDSMARLAELLTAADGTDPSAEQLQTAGFLGTCIGYLERTEPRGVDSLSVADSKSALVAHFGEAHLAAFDEGRRAVGSKLELLQEELQARRTRAAEADAKKAERIAADLKAAVNVQADARESGQSHAERTKESQRELRVIQQQLNSLAPDRARLSAQIIALQAQLAELQNPTTNTTTNQAVVENRGVEGPRAGDVFVGTRTSSTTTVDLNRLAQAQAVALTLAVLNKQAFDMDRVIVGLQSRGAELAGISQAEFAKLSENQAAAEKAAKRAERLSKQLERHEQSDLESKSRMTPQMTRFSTYAPLPYEQETQRVLSWFEK